MYFRLMTRVKFKRQYTLSDFELANLLGTNHSYINILETWKNSLLIFTYNDPIDFTTYGNISLVEKRMPLTFSDTYMGSQTIL